MQGSSADPRRLGGDATSLHRAANAAAAIAAATLVAEVATYPICTLSTRYMTQPSHFPRLTIPQMTRAMWREGPVRTSFYRGLVWASVGQVLGTACKYTLTRVLYDEAEKRQCKADQASYQPSPTWKRLLILNGAPCIAGVALTLVTHPFDWLKIDMQKKIGSERHLLRSDPSLLYRGWSRSATKQGVGGVAWLGLYFTLTRECNLSVAVASTITAITAPALTGCLNTLKVQHTAGILPKVSADQTTLCGTLKRIYMGNSLNMARLIPHFVISMSMSEYILRASQ